MAPGEQWDPREAVERLLDALPAATALDAMLASDP
jgi:hypothetical protein